MDYLSFEEFKELSQREIEKDEFDKLIKKASAMLDTVTSFFYVRNDLEKDNLWRSRQFKMALCSQVEYFHVLGATTHEEINNAPQTFSAGRTSVSNASRYKTNGKNESKSLVAEDVFVFLSGTGLLYRGVATW